jgi:hypothetical protein
VFDLELLGILTGANRALSSAILLTSFSLLVYVLSHNFFSAVGRAFTALMGFVTVVYIGDVAVANVAQGQNALFWLHFQWLGIAFVPAAYLHLSRVLLRAVKGESPGGRYVTLAAYALGAVFLGLSSATELIVWDGVVSSGMAHLKAGPLFWLFAAYFAVATALGAVNIASARQLAPTRASRRRLSYLAATFAAPGLGVFPFLVLVGVPGASSAVLVAALSAVGNAVVLLMLIVMAYSVAYYGVLAPERVVKQSFIEYVLRGPFVGVCVLTVMLAVPEGTVVLGLRRGAFLVFAVVGTIVLLQVAISLGRPVIDLVAFRQDRAEVSWLRELERRLLTTTDFLQVLENVLVAVCDELGSDAGFVAAVPPGDLGDLKVEASVGQVGDVPQLPELAEWLQAAGESRSEGNGTDGAERPAGDILLSRGYWLVALMTRDEGIPLGVLGVRARLEGKPTRDQAESLLAFSSKAAAAIEDMRLQRQVFSALRRLLPDIETVQRWRGDASFGTASAMLTNPVLTPDFPDLVRAALRHYWGGPELGQSPLLQLQVVRQALRENDSNPAKALRAVLVRAIEALRPTGPRDISPEWVLYNVLEMKYVQGLKAREIARRLAVSESDLYRKQRVAVKEVARVLAEMELQACKPKA